MALQYEYEFSDGQTLVGDNATSVSSYVNEKNNAATNKTAWGGNRNAEIGGMSFVAAISGANQAGGTVTVSLVTAATNNLNATGTVLATVTAFNNSALGTKYSARLPAGTTRLKYLGARIVGAGNITAGNLECYLTAHDAELTD